MHPSSASADLPGIAYLAVLLRQNCFFIAIFPAELGGTTAHLRRLPRKGRAGGAKKSLLKHRVQGTALPAMHPSSPSADYISDAFLRLCFGRAVFAVCAPQNGAYNKAPPLRFWSGGALFVRVYSRKAVCGIGDWDISARAFRLSLSGGAKQGDTGL